MENHLAESSTEWAVENGTYLNIEDDPFGEDFHYHYSICLTYSHITGIIRLLLCVVSIAAHIFLATAILKFKPLQTRINMYILNMSIQHTFLYIVVFLLVVCGGGVFILSTIGSMMLLYVTTAFMLGVDWFFSTWKSEWMVKYIKTFRYVMAGVYCMFAVEIIPALLSYEYDKRSELRLQFISAIYLLYMLLFIVIHCYKRKLLNSTYRKAEYAFTVAKITIYTFFPMFVYHVLDYIVFFRIVGDFPFLYLVMCYIEPLPSVLLLGHPVIIAYALGKESKQFKMAFSKMLKRSLRNYDDNDLEEMSEGGDSENKIKVSFTNSRIDINM